MSGNVKAGKSVAAKAAAKSTAAAAKALAAEKDAVWHKNAVAESDEEEPKPAKAAKEPKEKKEKKEKRTRAPSAFNLYMKARLAEMKLDDAVMAEYPDHKQRFTQAAGEWSAMTDEEKAAKKAEFASVVEQTTPPAMKPPTKAPGAPSKAKPKRLDDLLAQAGAGPNDSDSGDDNSDDDA